MVIEDRETNQLEGMDPEVDIPIGPDPTGIHHKIGTTEMAEMVGLDQEIGKTQRTDLTVGQDQEKIGANTPELATLETITGQGQGRGKILQEFKCYAIL